MSPFLLPSLVNIILFGYTEATGATLTCQFRGEANAAPFNAADGKSAVFDLQAHDVRLWKLRAAVGTSRVTCQTTVQDGDLDLFMRIGDLPIPYVEGLYDCEAVTDAGAEYCELTNAELSAGADVYILLHSYGNVTSAQLTCNGVLSVDSQILTAADAERLNLGQTQRSFNLLENQVRKKQLG